MNVFLLKLSSVLGLSLTSGINLYATVAVVGLIAKFDLIRNLPPEFEAFNNDLVIVLALILYACEFAADKIPAFDSIWDTVHTAIRPFGAALIAMTVVGDAEPAVAIAAGLLGASLGLATHTAKAGTRLAANTSPEPFSNVALSLGEDAAVVGMSVLVLSHPYISLVLSLVVLALLVRFGPGLWRGALLVLGAVPARIAGAVSSKSPEDAPLTGFLPDAIEGIVDREISGGESVHAAQACHARKVKGTGRNRKGYLILTDRRLLFVFRKLFRTRTREWKISDLKKVELNRRFLVDVLRVKCDRALVSFIFPRNRLEPAVRLFHDLEQWIGHDGTAGREDGQAQVLFLGESQSRSA